MVQAPLDSASPAAAASSTLRIIGKMIPIAPASSTGLNPWSTTPVVALMANRPPALLSRE